ncbi:PREDICTED: EH domain-binding protein 1-like protein 1 isoform X2 [Amphimedon queenslandica]|uniref:protein-disulfide reductase n=1 Tax=Amphimedon queenslandica TaxID=400682 RepID=A0A1X7U0M2_AMPQE|nr:PREDICTED: EH domain-binding protein 1-like protein 1 isoform X2 [Amphimedon queenslandica]|eukprot:XP_019856658.1 PREDICTED: EH domain-binding protein 1-like protein 1 isoform X2 [Amphimedon queenslandica]
MAKRFARKVKRAGKSATQFRFTSTFEYIDLTCNGTWRPGSLRVIWLRSHRRVQSSDVEFVVTEDRGPNGADGRAVFDPPISASLIVTLYRDGKKQEFEEKEYKYYIENEDKNGKKILASFNCDMAEYAGIPSARHALEMNFKPVSRKISKSLLGITLEAEFQKEGKDTDDDMQSTFSSVDPAQSVMYADDEDVDDEDLDEAATLGMRPKSPEEEENEETPAANEENEPGPLRSIVVLGTGETRRRSQLRLQPPPVKPPRSDKSMENLLDIDKGNEITDKLETQGDEGNIFEAEKPDEEKEGNEEIVKDGKDELMEGGAPESSNGGVIEESQLESLSNDNVGMKGEEEECSSKKKKKEECSSSSKEGKNEEECSNSKEAKEMEQEEKECSSSKETKEKAKEEECSSSKEGKKKEEECSSKKAEDLEKAKEGECSSSKEESNKKEEGPCGATPIAVSAPPTKSSSEPHSCDEEMPQRKKNDTASKGTGASTTAGESTASAPMTDEARRKGHPGPPFGGVTAGASGGGPADKQPFTDPQGANPFDEPAKEQSPPPTSPGRNAALVNTWLPDAQYVDCHDVGVGNERVDSADVIGLYFSAQWCPPCRRFLPKLLEFYTSLKKNNKSFEMIYISNDNSRTEMIQYMAEQQMPWVAIPHGHPLIDKLKLDFKVRSIPLLVIVSASGETLDDNAKKAVEGTHVAASSTIKQYNKWLEKAGKSADDEDRQKTGGGGILGSIKKALGGKDDEIPPTSPSTETHLREAAESKSHKTTVNEKHNKEELLRQLQQKEDIIRHLEEVNQSLKITNDELNTEVRTLKTGLEQSEAKVKVLEASTAQKKQEDEKLREHLKVQGWLFKKGAKGPTANVFRRRYFRLDQGSRLYYYKSQSEGTPQGFIDLAKVIEVSAADASKQDKNNGTFNINCEGRVFELLAHDEAEMNKWISAITYLAKYFKEKGASPN